MDLRGDGGWALQGIKGRGWEKIKKIMTY